MVPLAEELRAQPQKVTRSSLNSVRSMGKIDAREAIIGGLGLSSSAGTEPAARQTRSANDKNRDMQQKINYLLDGGWNVYRLFLFR